MSSKNIIWLRNELIGVSIMRIIGIPILLIVLLLGLGKTGIPIMMFKFKALLGGINLFFSEGSNKEKKHQCRRRKERREVDP